jgi:hypothetical protein
MAIASKVFLKGVDKLGLKGSITDRGMRKVFHVLRHSCVIWSVNALLGHDHCRSRKKPRERRSQLRNSLFLRCVTFRLLTFCEAINIQVE